jgi:hypothetical protein
VPAGEATRGKAVIEVQPVDRVQSRFPVLRTAPASSSAPSSSRRGSRTVGDRLIRRSRASCVAVGSSPGPAAPARGMRCCSSVRHRIPRTLHRIVDMSSRSTQFTPIRGIVFEHPVDCADRAADLRARARRGCCHGGSPLLSASLGRRPTRTTRQESSRAPRPQLRPLPGEPPPSAHIRYGCGNSTTGDRDVGARSGRVHGLGA